MSGADIGIFQNKLKMPMKWATSVWEVFLSFSALTGFWSFTRTKAERRENHSHPIKKEIRWSAARQMAAQLLPAAAASAEQSEAGRGQLVS